MNEVMNKSMFIIFNIFVFISVLIFVFDLYEKKLYYYHWQKKEIMNLVTKQDQNRSLDGWNVIKEI